MKIKEITNTNRITLWKKSLLLASMILLLSCINMKAKASVTVTNNTKCGICAYHNVDGRGGYQFIPSNSSVQVETPSKITIYTVATPDGTNPITKMPINTMTRLFTVQYENGNPMRIPTWSQRGNNFYPEVDYQQASDQITLSEGDKYCQEASGISSCQNNYGG